MTGSVWLLHDGKVGLRNQAMGVAEAVGLDFVDKTLAIRPPWRWLPPSLWLAARHAPGRGGDRLLPPWPILAISAGGRGAAPALAVRRAAGGRCLVVQVQSPGIAAGRFDLMIVPEHDPVRGPNVMVTLGAVHRVTRAKLDEAAALWSGRLANLPHPRVAVLLGGGNGSYELDRPDMLEIGDSLAKLARKGAGLMITPSRRTPAELIGLLRQHLAGLPAVLWDGVGDNPYFAYLGLADHVIATADSVSMITEAAATGKPVYVIPIAGGAPKFLRFHEAMARAGITRTWTGGLGHWTYAMPDHTAEAGARIHAMLRDRGLIPPGAV